jgi:hypothetical protein
MIRPCGRRAADTTELSPPISLAWMRLGEVSDGPSNVAARIEALGREIGGTSGACAATSPLEKNHSLAFQNLGNQSVDISRIDAAICSALSEDQDSALATTLLARQNLVGPIPRQLLLPTSSVLGDMQQCSQ